MENRGGSCGISSISTGRRATETNHRDQKRHVRSSGSALVRFSEHCHQRKRVANAVSSVHENRKIWRFDFESDRAADGFIQHLRRLVEIYQFVHRVLSIDINLESVAREQRQD